jgi:transposase-like protein
MKKKKAPVTEVVEETSVPVVEVTEETSVPVAEVTDVENIPVVDTTEVKKAEVNCPKCGTALRVKLGNYAHVCPVCNYVFRTRKGQRLVKDVSRQTMMEAFVTVGKDANGEVKTEKVLKEKK